ncbi:GNAT family N-acetyltransferase [Mucilaginibacter terrae]|uniref:Ribosomal protein S18 acetylase RimI-like enzyme n=1 Tax=Mucilaginibacter terrae TaxID=1955052 RepID=A0ABU3GWP0_9SPHI|nr:GNAT family N-acetyltransferase [Mucilaginibacter terrae]MDT3404179.1 ribosomal protein S18 acetylase RimI-like enzyme [Mucilaginibacter terrae]
MLNIRPATLADADHIVKIAHQTWWPTYRSILSTEQITYMLDTMYVSDKIADQMDKGEQLYLILEEEGIPVAFASYSPRTEDENIYKLHKLYCHPSTQGKGHGRKLVEAVMEAARKAGKSALDLNVNRNNNAKSFYEKMGFTVLHDEDIAIGPYWMNDHVMRIAL